MFNSKLTSAILEKFIGGELDIWNPSSCHYRGKIAKMIFCLDAAGGVCAIRVQFRWLLPKQGNRLVPMEAVRRWRPRKFQMVFGFEQVLFVKKDEIKIRTTLSSHEFLRFIAPRSKEHLADRDKLHQLVLRNLL